MDDISARLECISLAMEQAKVEGRHGRTEIVLEIATRFYNFAAADKPKRGRPRKDSGQPATAP